MRILGIIPARGGSKGVPNKNILEFDGKPLIAYAIEAGQTSGLTELVVSTDDEEIARVARKYNCKVMNRPKILATGTSNVTDTALDILAKFEKEEVFFDAVLLLQPTAPLRSSEDIRNSVALLEREESEAVVSMIPVGDSHPARMYRLEGGRAVSEMPEYESVRRQDLPERFIRNGCIYLVRRETLQKRKTFLPSNITAYVMDPKWAVNIDTKMDVLILNSLIKEWNRSSR